MLLECEKRVFTLHTVTVIAHAYQRNPSFFDPNNNTAGSGIECILDQLLDHRGRALDHLTGGDLVSDDFWKETDETHAAPPL